MNVNSALIKASISEYISNGNARILTIEENKLPHKISEMCKINKEMNTIVLVGGG